jgi:hypothetical protein
MGFFDRFKKKKDEPEAKERKEPDNKPAGKRVKKYTSDGKPVYE